MNSLPKTYLFGKHLIATASSGDSSYSHTFGGPHDRRGISREDCKGIHIHLLHRLDLRDPSIPIVIPGIRWLPLYYCFDFRVNELGYRLISDDSLIAFFHENERNVTKTEEWPDEDFPLEFPRSSISIAPYAYNPKKLDDAYEWSGIFGIGNLSKADQARAKKRIAGERKGLGFHAPETDEEFDAELSSPFAQGKPNTKCMNPDCPKHKEDGRLSTIALMPDEPVRGVRTFGEMGRGVELIFQMCGQCHTICVSNQCT
jgi:hypothetical protein